MAIPRWVLGRVEPGGAAVLINGRHVLKLHDPKLVALVSIVVRPD